MSYVGKRVPRIDAARQGHRARRVRQRRAAPRDAARGGAAQPASPRPHRRDRHADGPAAPGVRRWSPGGTSPSPSARRSRTSPSWRSTGCATSGNRWRRWPPRPNCRPRRPRADRGRVRGAAGRLRPEGRPGRGGALVHPGPAHLPAGAARDRAPHQRLHRGPLRPRGCAGALPAADFVFEDEFSAHGAEPRRDGDPRRGRAVRRRPTGGYTVWVSSDRPFQLRAELAEALGLPSSRVRVISGQVGGSFGGKNTLVAEAPAVALARFTGGRPVRVEFSREEDLTASQMRHAAYIRLKTGVKRDGTLVARSADLLWDSGAYASNAVGIAIRGPKAVFGPYRIPHIEVRLPDGLHQQADHRLVPGLRHHPGDLGLRVADGHDRPPPRDRPLAAPPAERLRGRGPVAQRPDPPRPERPETLERASTEIGWGTPPTAPAPHCAAARASPR